MALKFWTNQIVTMQSVIGAVVPITAITKAANAEVSAGTLPAANEYVLLEVVGMNQVNRRIFKATAPSAGKFSIGEDTTAYGTFVSGSYRLITLGTAFDSVRDLQSGGGDAVFEDTTTIHDAGDTQAIVSSSPETIGFTVDWEPTNNALKACNTAFSTRTPRAFKFQDPDGSEYLFYAYVAAPMNPTTGGRKKVTPVNLALLASGKAY